MRITVPSTRAKELITSMVIFQPIPFHMKATHYSFCTTCISSYSLVNSCACKTGASVREKTVKAIQISASPQWWKSKQLQTILSHLRQCTMERFHYLKLYIKRKQLMFQWLQFGKVTIIHTEENHGGICRRLGAQGQKRLAVHRICLCDCSSHYATNCERRNNSTDQQSFTRLKQQWYFVSLLQCQISSCKTGRDAKTT